MSKSSSSKLDVTNIVTPAPDAPEAVVATVVKKPKTLELFGPASQVMQQVCIHCRAGYTPSMNVVMDVYGVPGYIRIVLELGDPDPAYAAVAAASVADAVALEQIEFNKAVAKEAARLNQAKADAEAAAKRAELVAIQKQQLADLESQIAALTVATAE